jgi:hypothetical protein
MIRLYDSKYTSFFSEITGLHALLAWSDQLSHHRTQISWATRAPPPWSPKPPWMSTGVPLLGDITSNIDVARSPILRRGGVPMWIRQCPHKAPQGGRIYPQQWQILCWRIEGKMEEELALPSLWRLPTFRATLWLLWNKGAEAEGVGARMVLLSSRLWKWFLHKREGDLFVIKKIMFDLWLWRGNGLFLILVPYWLGLTTSLLNHIPTLRATPFRVVWFLLVLVSQ